MGFPLIPLLASVAPSIVKWAIGDKAGEVAQGVADIAMRVTGKDTPESAVDALKADPAKMIEFQAQMNAFEIAMYQEESKRIAEINQTMRIEAQSGDSYVRRMRPTFGYAMALTWATQMAAVSWVIVTDPASAGAVIAAMASLSTIWSVALAVLGVYSYGRTQEKKQAMAGEENKGFEVISALVDKFKNSR